MNKFSFSLAFAAVAALVLACSEDKKDPTHEELCATPLKRECLVGPWVFDGVYQNENADTKSNDCPEPGYLEFRADGDYIFTGGVWDNEVVGTWTFNGNSITVTNNIYNVYSKDGTITVSNGGRNMTVKTTGPSAFAHCESDKTEKFRWNGK